MDSVEQERRAGGGRNPAEEVARKGILQEGWTVTRRDVPYVPTDEQVVRGMLKLGRVGPEDVVYDLGCGDGRIVLAAARRCGARGVGVEIDPQRLGECAENGRRMARGRQVALPDGGVGWEVMVEHGLRGAARPVVRFVEKSLFELDFSEATVVMVYLLPKINQRLIPTFLGMRAGTRIVSNTFPMGYEAPLWRPDEEVEAHRKKLMKWTVPARVAGVWRGVAADGAGGRWRVGVRLGQMYQEVDGEAWVGDGGRRRWRQVPLGRTRVAGEELRLHLPVGWRGGPVDVAVRAQGGYLRGRWADRAGGGAVWLARGV